MYTYIIHTYLFTYHNCLLFSFEQDAFPGLVSFLRVNFTQGCCDVCSMWKKIQAMIFFFLLYWFSERKRNAIIRYTSDMIYSKTYIQLSNKGMQFFYLELEKMINLPNYTDEQLKEDY